MGKKLFLEISLVLVLLVTIFGGFVSAAYEPCQYSDIGKFKCNDTNVFVCTGVWFNIGYKIPAMFDADLDSHGPTTLTGKILTLQLCGVTATDDCADRLCRNPL